MENVGRIDEKRNARKKSRKNPTETNKYKSKNNVKINRRKLGCEVQESVQVRLENF
jgi:hypothetical protein